MPYRIFLKIVRYHLEHCNNKIHLHQTLSMDHNTRTMTLLVSISQDAEKENTSNDLSDDSYKALS